MADDLFGPIQPPRWMSNFETMLLNQESGRAQAASFNQAYQSAFGKQQETKEYGKKKNIEFDYEKKISDEIAKRIQPFIDDLQRKDSGSGMLPPTEYPWQIEGTGAAVGSNIGFGGNPQYQSPEYAYSHIIGESGPDDPTYQDFQRAKAKHPGLWLDPWTAPLMERMDRSWDRMEQTKMEAEQMKDRHEAVQTKQALDQIAMDVGKQGVNRLLMREDAYGKVPSEIQVKIESTLPNGGRYPADSPISKIFGGKPPLTPAAEQILNNYKESVGEERIDGANRDAVNEVKVKKFLDTHPGYSVEWTFDSTGKKGFKFKPPPAGSINEEPVIKDIGGGIKIAYFKGGKTIHVIKTGGDKEELTPKLAVTLAEKLPDGPDRDFLIEWATEKLKTQTKGWKPSEKPAKQGIMDRLGGLMDKFFGAEPSPLQPQATANPVTEDFWGKPAPQAEPVAEPTATTEPEPAATQPAAATTPVTPPAPTQTPAPAPPPESKTNAPAKKSTVRVKTQADIDKAWKLAQEAIANGADESEVIKKLIDIGAAKPKTNAPAAK